MRSGGALSLFSRLPSQDETEEAVAAAATTLRASTGDITGPGPHGTFEVTAYFSAPRSHTHTRARAYTRIIRSRGAAR